MTDNKDDKNKFDIAKIRSIPKLSDQERQKIVRSTSVARGVMSEIEDTPSFRLAQALRETPSFQLAKAVQDIPAVRLQREWEESGAGRVAKHFQNSGMLDALHEFSARQNALAESFARLFETSDSPGSQFAKRIQDMTSGMAVALQNLPRFQPETITNLQRISSAVSSLNVAKFAGLVDSRLFTDVQSVSVRMTDVIESFRLSENIAIGVGLSESIRDLMERSLAVQEVILEEQRKSGEEARKDSLFNRRIAYLNTMYLTLTFFLALALAIEQWQGDDDAGEGVDPAQITAMQESLETMAEQLEALEERDVKEAEREAAADAELAAIMRGIAGSLETEQGSGADGADSISELP